MQRFVVVLALTGLLLLVAALVFWVIPFDPLSLQTVLTSDGEFDPFTRYGIGGLEGGLVLAALSLLILAFLFYLCERGTIRLFEWPTARFLLIIIAVQVILGLLYITHVTYKPGADFEWYHRQALNLSEGYGVVDIWGDPTAFWPVGYPLLLSIFYRLFGAKLIVAQVLNLFLFSGITVFTYLLGRKLFDSKTARRAALLIAFVPSQTFYALMPMADIPFSLLVAGILYLTIRKASLFNTLLLGLLIGYAALVRPVILFFPLLLAAYRILRDKRWKPALFQLVIIVIISEAILVPWQIRNYKAFGTFVLVSTNGGYNLWMGNNQHASGGVLNPPVYISRETQLWLDSINEAERDQYAFKQGISYAVSHPAHTFVLAFKKLLHLYFKDSKCITYGLHANYEHISPAALSAMVLLTEGYYYALGIAFLISMCVLFRRDKLSMRVLLITGIVLYFWVIHLPFIAESRFHMPLMPLFAIVACVPRSLGKSPNSFQ